MTSAGQSQPFTVAVSVYLLLLTVALISCGVTLIHQSHLLSEQTTQLSEQTSQLSQQSTQLSQQATQLSQQALLLDQLSTVRKEDAEKINDMRVEVALLKEKMAVSKQDRNVREKRQVVGDSSQSTVWLQGPPGSPGRDASACQNHLIDFYINSTISTLVREESDKIALTLRSNLLEFNSTLSSLVRQETEQFTNAAERLRLLASQAPTVAGASYILWGRTSCPAGVNTTLVYSGRAAGTYYGSQGGSSQYLCLPDDPQYANNSAAAGFTLISGAEYQYFPTAAAHDHNVPCSVCLATKRATQRMFPARLSCPTGWTYEYKGFVMSESTGHRRTEYVCVSEAPQIIADTPGNEDGALFYAVRASCSGSGRLHNCPPYLANKELTCVVCSI